ncbi:MAG: hypothetical protein C0613_07895 [Desulfobulbaceae bacterium]|nr:MAG: hypothetical protein C0613_07895 [Desulfobulbaceae bacterium]
MLETQQSQAVKLVGFSDIKTRPIDGWQEFLAHGDQFLLTAGKAYLKRKQAFTPEILYNLIAMAIEKLLMAVLMKSGNLPYNHTMHDLVESMEEFLPGELTAQAEELKALDDYQEICDIDSYNITPPTMAEVSGMLELAKEVQRITLNKIAH